MYNYVDSPNSNLICCICRLPFTDPTTTRTCAHTFCRDCILRAIEHSTQCPIDRSPLTPDDLSSAGPIIHSLVDELVVECVHRAEGCMYTCQRQHLPIHLINSCAYREVSQGKCEENVQLQTHEEEEINGPHEILHPLLDSQSETVADDCINPFSNMTSKAVQTQHIPCSCSSQEFAHHNVGVTPLIVSPVDHRLANLSEQNIVLRHRVADLENLVRKFQRDMGAVKRALGPWFRVGEGVGAGYIPPDTPMEAQRSSTSTTSPSTTSAGMSLLVGTEASASDSPSSSFYQYHNRGPFPSNTPPATDSLAPYFPPELEGASSQRPRMPSVSVAHRPGSSTNVEFLTSSQHDPHAFLPQPTIVHTPPVAPLNLNSTLEETLHGLRESVVGLATSVDSMGRRREVTSTHETRRMGEEIVGLWARIHQIRMQVSAIMMDRNTQIPGREGIGEGSSAGQWMPLPASPTIQARMYYPQQPSITKL